MSAVFESTIYCERSKEVLEEIMQKAVNLYLSSNTTVSLVEKKDRYITLKIPMNLKSWGEILEVSVEEESFHITSKCSAFFQIVAWGRNRNNFRDMCICLENAISDHNEQ